MTKSFKKKFISFFMFLTLFLAACNNQSEETYNKALQDGLDALVSEEYEKAEVYFEIALEEKSEDERAQVLLNQTSNMNKAISLYNQDKLVEAREKAEEVSNFSNGSESLIKIANNLIEEIDAINDTASNYQKHYDDASQLLASGTLEEALVKVEGLLNEDKIMEKNHVLIKQEAEILKEKIENKLLEISETKAQEEATRIAKEEEEASQGNDNVIEAYNNLDINLKVLLATTIVDERAMSPGLMGYQLIYNFDQNHLFVHITSGVGSGHPWYMLQYDSEYIYPIEGVVSMGISGYDYTLVDTNPISKIDLYNRYLDAKDAYDAAIYKVEKDTTFTMEKYQEIQSLVVQ